MQKSPQIREVMALYQNLNSGSLRTNGRNSSIKGDPIEFPGKNPPSSSPCKEASLSNPDSSSVMAGSNLGLKNNKNIFNK